jgi:acetyltransferase-like isoleucine patch superfamily enzyme
MRLGTAVTVGYRVTIDVGTGAMLDIGHHVNLTQDLLISCGKSVQIGDHSGVGEFSSIRDGDHGYAVESRIHEQATLYNEIVIGSDVQISRGCFVTGGSRVEHGVIIGANSTITGRIKTVEYGIYMGQPVKLIGQRT